MKHHGTKWLPAEVPKWLSGSVLSLLMLLLLPATALAQELNHTAPQEAVIEGVFHIKVAETAAPSIQLDVQDGIARMGIASLDQLSTEYQVTRVERMFRSNPRYADRHARWGLDRWYRVYFEAGDVALTRDAMLAFHADPNTELAEHVLVKEHTFAPVNEGLESFGDAVQTGLAANPDFPGEGDPSDPLYADQWHYQNTGQTGGTAGADISLPQAWEIETGSPDVIVQVVDAGMQIDHPDLAQNLWINPDEVADGTDTDGNGFIDDIYGYNFANNNADVAPNNPNAQGDSHGIHVSGTIAAVTNNEEGVSGVAGGDGSPDSGVRIMTAQTFSNIVGGFAEAIVYGADNGAVISSNSWGYTAPGVFEQAVLDAIDYFVAEAGGPDAPMNGGLFVNSAGNSNSSASFYPGFYPPAMAVAATDHNDGKASYSNFGDWVEIAAPGGEAFAHPVISTLHENVGAYGGPVWAGTSMAAPHVSGAAALLISKEPGLDVELVRSRLIETGDELDTPFEIGPRVNAFQLLQEDDGVPPVAIGDLEVLAVGQATADLQWTAPEGDPAQYDLRFSTSPIDAGNFEEATPFDGVPTPSAPGTTEEVTVTGLAPGTTHYFAVRSSDIFANVSDISNVVSATTEGAPFLVISPEELETTLEVDTQQDELLTFTNDGEGTLEWSFPSFAALALTSDPTLEQNDPGTFPALDLQKGENDPRDGNPILLGAGGPDAFGYTWIDSNEAGGPAFDFFDISGIGDEVTALTGTDDGNTVLDLPFAYEHYGEFHEDMTVSVNGWLHFGDFSFGGFTNQPIPDSDAPNDLLAVFWDDLDMRDQGRVYTYFDEATNRFIVQWDDVEKLADGEGTTLTFQAVLTPIGGALYQYDTMNATLNSATVGIENADGTDGLQVAFNTDYMEEGLAVQISSPTPDFISFDVTSGEIAEGASQDITATFDATGQIGNTTVTGEIALFSNDPSAPNRDLPVVMNVTGGTPEISVSDDAIDFGTIIAGTATTEELTITNTGEAAALSVSDLMFDNDTFRVPPTTTNLFELLPGESQAITIEFTPPTPGSFEGTLSIASNDPATPELDVALSGQAGEAPVLAFDPDSFEETLQAGDSSSDVLTIGNEGGSDLNYGLTIDFMGSEPSNPEHASLFASSGAFDATPPEELSAGAAPTGLAPAEGVHQRTLSLQSVEETDYWGVQSTGVGEGDFGFFSGGDPETFNVVGAFDVQGFPNAGDFPVGDDSFVYSLDNEGNLSAITLADGSVEELGTVGSDWTGWATDPTDGTYYVSTGDALFTLDVDALATEEIGSFGVPLMIDIAIDGDGQMYGYSVQTNLFYEIDKENGTTTEVGNIGFDANFGQGLTWDSQNDEILMSAFNNTSFQSEFRIVDRTSGSTELVGVLPEQMGWLAVPLGGASEWLAVDPVEGTVAVGESADVDVQFATSFAEADDLIAGFDYLANIDVATNDPSTPEASIPVTLTVTGDPAIVLSDDTIDFGTVFAGTSATESLTISNEGVAILEVTSLTSNNAVFEVNGDGFTLLPGASMTVPITFTPDDSGSFDGTLAIANNDQDVNVTLVGEGSPFVTLDPTELTQTIDLTTGDSMATQTFTVTNEFDGPLPVSFFIENLQSESPSLSFTTDLVDEQLLRWQEMGTTARVQRYALEDHTAGADPGAAAPSTAGSVGLFAALEDEVGVTGFGNDVFFTNDNIVAFDIGLPEALTIVDDGVDSFAGNFIFGNNEEIYWIDNSDNNLKTYVLEDGSVEVIGELVPESSAEGWTDLETDYTDGTTYVTTYDPPSGESRLYALDPENAELTYRGAFYDGINIALAIDDQGQGYGHSITEDIILLVDLETAESEVLGSTGIDANFAQSMTFDSATGQVLMAAYEGSLAPTPGSLRLVDRETGATTLIGPIGVASEANELGWFATPGTGISWLATNITQATIEPGNSVEVTAHFDASELVQGDYEAQISVVGEELAGQPSEALPVFLTVIGEPELFLSQEALDFGELFVNATSSPQMVTIRNDGTAPVDLDVSIGDGFSFDGPSALSLAPGDAQVYNVSFAPEAVQTFDTELSFDGDVSASVQLTGEGIEAPALAVDPAGFEDQILIGQTRTYALEVTNAGADTLAYEAAISTPPEDLASGALEVLLEEDFATGVPPGDWFSAGANDGNNWTTECFGRPADLLPAAVFCWSPSNTGTQRLVTPQLDTGAYGAIVAQFTHTVNHFDGDYEIRLESTGDGGETWTTVAEFPAADLPATDEMIVIDNADVGSDEFHLAWTFEGNSFNINEWGFTDVTIAGELNWLTIDPAEGALEAGESLVHTLTADASDLEEGTFELGVLVNTNDPLAPTAFVPFTLTVVENVTVSTPDAELNPNQVANVPVSVSSLDGLDVVSYQFTLEYDPELLSAIGVNTEGTLSEGAEIAVNNEADGVVSVAAFSVGTDGLPDPDAPALFQLEGEGTLIELVVQAQEALGETTPVATEFLFNEGLDDGSGPGAAADLGTVSVVPLFGDIALNLDVTSFDAALALQSAVGLIELNEAQATSGDVSGGGSVTAFDGGLIQQFVVGLIDSFPVEGEEDALMAATTAEDAQASLAWSDAETNGLFTQLPLVVDDVSGTVTSVAITAPIDGTLMAIEDVEGTLPSDWMIAHHVQDDVLRIAMAGATPLESGQVATLAIEWLDDDAQMTFDSEVTVNQNAPQSLSAEIGTLPDEFALHGSYPNPFRGNTTIEYELPEKAHVRIAVFNVLGQEVAVLVDEEQAAGRYDVRWDGRGMTGAPVASGVYIYRIEAGDFSATERATRVR